MTATNLISGILVAFTWNDPITAAPTASDDTPTLRCGHHSISHYHKLIIKYLMDDGGVMQIFSCNAITVYISTVHL